MFNTNKDLSNAKSIASLVAGLEVNFNIDNIDQADLVFCLLAMEVNETQLNKKKEHKSNKSDVAK